MVKTATTSRSCNFSTRARPTPAAWLLWHRVPAISRRAQHVDDLLDMIDGVGSCLFLDLTASKPAIAAKLRQRAPRASAPDTRRCRDCNRSMVLRFWPRSTQGATGSRLQHS